MMGLRSNTPRPVRCNYCQRRTDYPYNCTIGGISYDFCGGPHARLAEKNFNEKVEKGITPASTEIIEEVNSDVEAE